MQGFQCRMCGKSGGPELFYRTSMSRCRECVNRLTRKRYQEKYKDQLRLARQEKSRALKAQQVNLSETDRAYAAGLIDGEGSIRMTRRGRSGGTSLRVGQHTLMVEMTNTDQEMLLWLQGRFGGSISYAKENPQKNSREKWHWRVAANMALRCLDAIWPYVRTKRKQAKLGRRFQRYVQRHSASMTEKRYNLQTRFYYELRALNKRGIRPAASAA
jgi:hypothetical protein